MVSNYVFEADAVRRRTVSSCVRAPRRSTRRSLSMPEVKQVLDRNGKPVLVGSWVRVVSIAAFLERHLPPDDWKQVRSMLGEFFEVYHIHELGGAWVQYQSHSLSLASDEMELVEAQT